MNNACTSSALFRKLKQKIPSIMFVNINGPGCNSSHANKGLRPAFSRFKSHIFTITRIVLLLQILLVFANRKHKINTR